MTTLERVFQDAFCTEPVPVGTTVLCGCQQEHESTEEKPVLIGAISGIPVVKGCTCEAASKAGNMIYGNRHKIAAFLRGMSDALKEDSERMLRVLPKPEEMK